MIGLHLFDAMGHFGWLFLILGALGLTVFFERIFYLQKVQIKANDFLEGILNLLKSGRSLEALTLCEETRGPVPSIVRAGLLYRDRSEDEIRRAIQSVAMVEIPLLEGRQRLLDVIAGLSPLLGLLGTVSAGVNALQNLSDAGRAAESANFAGDLSMALVTTAGGLAISITAYCGRRLLESRTDSILRDMELAAHGLVGFLSVEYEQRAPIEAISVSTANEE